MTICKTPVAARELGISYHRLFGMLRSAKLTPPQKDSSGDYIWTEDDMEAARQILLKDQDGKMVQSANHPNPEAGAR